MKILKKETKLGRFYEITWLHTLTEDDILLKGFQIKMLGMKMLYVKANSNWQNDKDVDFIFKIHEGVMYIFNLSLSIKKSKE